MARNLCHDLGRQVSVQCFDTFASATALCYVGRHVLFSTSVLLISSTTLLFSASALVLCATTLQYCTVSSGTYRVVSYSFIITGLGIPIII